MLQASINGMHYPVGMQNRRVVANPKARKAKQIIDSARHDASPDYPLQSLLQQAECFVQIETALYKIFPEWSSNGIRLACVKPHMLVITCTDSAWATRLRIQQNPILEAANRLTIIEISDYQPFKRLHIKLLSY